jgi:hypothetical protein
MVPASGLHASYRTHEARVPRQRRLTKQNDLKPVLSSDGPAEESTMDWSKVGKPLRRAWHRDEAAVLSRRDALAGIGLAGIFLFAGSKLLRPAEASPADLPAVDAEAISADAARAETTEPGTPEHAADTDDVTELTAQRWRRRYWRRRYWRRRYWRHRYWRRRYWRRRYWRHRYWRRRYWRRRYWY